MTTSSNFSAQAPPSQPIAPLEGSVDSTSEARTSARLQFIRCWGPLCAALLTSLLFVAFQDAFDLNRFAIPDAYKAAGMGPFTSNAHLEAARMHWATSIFVCTGLMVVLAGSAILAIGRSHPSPRFIAVLVASIAAIWVLFHSRPDAVVPPLLRREMELVLAASQFDPQPRLVVFLSGLFSTALLMTVAIACVLRPIAGDTASITSLNAAQRTSRDLLLLTTAWLVAGVIGIGLFHRMATASVSSDGAAALQTLGTSSTIFSGAYYSAILAATFAPAELVIRSAARRMKPTASAADLDKWLNDNGFQVSVPQVLMRVVALLGPLLAGVLQNLAQFG